MIAPARPLGKVISTSCPIFSLESHRIVNEMMAHDGPGPITLIAQATVTPPIIQAGIQLERQFNGLGEICMIRALHQRLSWTGEFELVGRAHVLWCLQPELPDSLSWSIAQLGSAIALERMPPTMGLTEWVKIDEDKRLRLIVSKGAQQLMTCGLNRLGSDSL